MSKGRPRREVKNLDMNRTRARAHASQLPARRSSYGPPASPADTGQPQRPTLHRRVGRQPLGSSESGWPHVCNGHGNMAAERPCPSVPVEAQQDGTALKTQGKEAGKENAPSRKQVKRTASEHRKDNYWSHNIYSTVRKKYP